MAYLHRLIFCLCLGVLAWLPTSSFAAAPVWSGWSPGDPSTYCPASFASSGTAAYGWALYAPLYTYTSTLQRATCRAQCTDVAKCGASLNAVGPIDGVILSRSFTCPATYSLNTTTLQCDPPAANNCTTQAGKSAGNYSGPGGTGLHSLCDTSVSSGDPALPGCLISGNANIAYGDPPDQTWSAAMAFTGDKCVPSGNNPTAPAPVGCPVGQVAGMVNGQPYCYKPDSSTPKTTTGGGSSTTTNPEGSKTKTDTTQTTNCNAAGSCTTTTNVTTTGTTAGGTTGTPVTTTTTSTCQRGSAGCQTTATTPAPVTTTSTTTGSTTTGGTTTNTSGTSMTTSTTSGGTGGNGSSSSGSGAGDGDGGAGGMFAGTCGAIPICDGDAVMCAVAAATFTTNCTLSDPKIPTPLYDAAITKTGDQTGSLPGNSTVNVSPSQFDQTELLGAAVGMSDRTITVAGQSISIPFSSVNIWLARLGVVLQAVTFLVCSRIVMRG